MDGRIMMMTILMIPMMGKDETDDGEEDDNGAYSQLIII